MQHVGDATDNDDHAQLTAIPATLQSSRAESDSTTSNAGRDDPVAVDLAQTRDTTLEDAEDAEDPAAAAVTAPADTSTEFGDASRPLADPMNDDARTYSMETVSNTLSPPPDPVSAPTPASPPRSVASSDSATSTATPLPDTSRLSLEETYLRERAAARARAREAELRLEAEVAARRAEEEEREAREARAQLLVERGRRPYAVEGTIRETP